MEASALSQFEIDSIMTALSDERGGQRVVRAAAKGAVKPYDFRRGNRLSKDHIRTLQMMHDTFARLLSTSLSSYLRMPVQVRLSSVEHAMHDEFMSRVTGPSVLSVVSLKPLSGRAVLAMKVELALAMLDRLLGGDGRAVDHAREVTDIELSLLESVASTFLGSLAEAWSSVVELEPAVEEISLNPQFLMRAMPNDSVVLFAFELKLQEMAGTLHLSIPYATVEPVLGKLNAQFWFSRGATASVDASGTLRQRLEVVDIPVRAELGYALVTVRELAGLQIGDVIHLNTFVDQELELYVGKEAKFRCRPGVYGNRIAVQVTGTVAAASTGQTRARQERADREVAYEQAS